MTSAAQKNADIQTSLSVYLIKPYWHCAR